MNKGFNFRDALKRVRPELAERVLLWQDKPERLVWPPRVHDEQLLFEHEHDNERKTS